VIVGNVGTVYRGPSLLASHRAYVGYVAVSKSGVGRAGNESVTRMINGSLLNEHTPDEAGVGHA
jgi:hypothetical protein